MRLQSSHVVVVRTNLNVQLMASKLQTDRTVQVLSTCMKYPRSVSQLVREIEGSHEGLLDLLKELEMDGLLMRRERKQRRGRPQRIMETTTLGKHFIQGYDQLMKLQLRSNVNDIRAAVHQGELAKRLEESGISPYTRFNEIVELATNISNTARHNTAPR